MPTKKFDKWNRRTTVAMVTLLTAALLVACGDSPTAAPTATLAPTTAPATTAAAATTVAPAAATTAAPTTVAATTSAPTTVAPTTAPATTAARPTVAATTAAPATTAATTVAATTAAAALPTVGNNYPAGPAPTAGVQAGGAKSVPLQIPNSLKNGRFATPHTMQVPEGFSISLYSALPSAPRFGTISPDGLLFVSLRSAGRIAILKDNGSGVSQEPIIFADGLAGPHGLAFHEYQGQMYLYVAENDRVSRFPYKNGQTRAEKRESIVSSLPSGGGHSTRSIAFGPDGKMYIAAGSSCNVCEESDPRRAAVTQYNADGTGQRVFALGLRNEVGIMFHPQTGELWGVENSRDSIGNDIPPEEINIIQDGKHYGWPYCISNQVYDTNFGRKDAAFCKQTVSPALPMQAHSAPLGFTFYTGKQFPADYQGDVFIGFHGSWNRDQKTGYKVVRVQVENGRPVSYDDFVTGWLNEKANDEWGRPVDVIAAPDGSLFITDDSANAVYRVTYNAKPGS